MKQHTVKLTIISPLLVLFGFLFLKVILSFHKKIKNRRNIIETDLSQRNPTPRVSTNRYANSPMEAVIDNHYDTIWSRMQGEAKKCALVLLYIEGKKNRQAQNLTLTKNPKF